MVIPSVDKVLHSSELVLDDQGKLREVNRVAGENEVSQKKISNLKIQIDFFLFRLVC